MHDRTWEKTYRDVDVCREVLRKIDSNSLERRAVRLSKESCVLMPVGYSMPGWTSNLIDEAGMCFTYGQFTGCIVSLAGDVEHGLRELCKGKATDDLQPLIDSAVSSGFVEAGEEEALTKLRKYRNYLAHARINKLAEGVPTGLGTIDMTDTEPTYDSSTEKTKLGLRFEDEVWAHLSAEATAGEIFLELREVLFDIFDRAHWEPKASDDQF